MCTKRAFNRGERREISPSSQRSSQKDKSSLTYAPTRL